MIFFFHFQGDQKRKPENCSIFSVGGKKPDKGINVKLTVSAMFLTWSKIILL